MLIEELHGHYIQTLPEDLTNKIKDYRGYIYAYTVNKNTVTVSPQFVSYRWQFKIKSNPECIGDSTSSRGVRIIAYLRGTDC